MTDVHTEHCCKWHGCKYSWGLEDDKKCTILDGAPQSYPCEHCSYLWEEYQRFINVDDGWVKYITDWKSKGGYI